MHSERAPRRCHGAELKAQVLAECKEPGASVAALTLSHGLNANLVHKWRRAQRRGRALAVTATLAPDDAASTFVALRLPPQRAAISAPPDIRIEVRRGGTTVNIA